eukprot:m.250695 g.250695  ORF g.250695 m.250695 type:complete len:156 (+) comp19101_c0_seq1:1277-1744(+)
MVAEQQRKKKKTAGGQSHTNNSWLPNAVFKRQASKQAIMLLVAIVLHTNHPQTATVAFVARAWIRRERGQARGRFLRSTRLAAMLRLLLAAPGPRTCRWQRGGWLWVAVAAVWAWLWTAWLLLPMLLPVAGVFHCLARQPHCLVLRKRGLIHVDA